MSDEPWVFRIRPTGPSPQEPDAVCDACGARGTVGRATRYDPPLAVWRYCRTCWPHERVRLETIADEPLTRWFPAMEAAAEWEPKPPRPPLPDWTFESALWSHFVEHATHLMTPLIPGDPEPEPDESLAAFAAELLAMAPHMDGPMPPVLAEFVRRYGPPAS
jgi:hypothetical protein